MNSIGGEYGVGLVEVLVAVLLLSVAVLGFSALQLRAVSATDESLLRTQAMSIIRGLSEDMRSNALQLPTYEKTINDFYANSITKDDISKMTSRCNNLENICSSEDIAKKQALKAIQQLADYNINITMSSCPGTENFSQIKCIIAAWDDTEPNMSDETTAKSCANKDGTYKSGASCVIVEAY